MIGDAEARLRAMVSRCTLETDRAMINSFMVWAHKEYWRTRFSSMGERGAVDAENAVRFREPGP